VTLDCARLAAEIHDRVIDWQRRIHADPEIGFDTVRTAALAAEALRAAGLEVRTGVGRTGVVADLDVPGGGGRLAFRADMDALPMDEEGDLPHRSRNPGAAHMCGHDAHTAMLLGAATVLAANRDALPRPMRFLFQPCEEAPPGGAPSMIEDGCLDGVERIYGQHVWPILPTGSVGIVRGPAMAQPDTWSIRLEGKGGHAAVPELARDPVVAAAHLATALQTVISRNVDPLDSAVLSVTQIHAGTADNIIPAEAKLTGTIRSFRTEVGDVVRGRLEEITRSVAAAFQVEATLDLVRGYPVLVNDGSACDVAEAALAGSDLELAPDAMPVLGGEDFAYYLEHVPGAFLFQGNRDEAKGIVHFCHHPRFVVDDAALRNGVELWLRLAVSGG
jgi:amidohydrolase